MSAGCPRPGALGAATLVRLQDWPVYVRLVRYSVGRRVRVGGRLPIYIEGRIERAEPQHHGHPCIAGVHYDEGPTIYLPCYREDGVGCWLGKSCTVVPECCDMVIARLECRHVGSTIVFRGYASPLAPGRYEISICAGFCAPIGGPGWWCWCTERAGARFEAVEAGAPREVALPAAVAFISALLVSSRPWSASARA
jgi:hypothetical protein